MILKEAAGSARSTTVTCYWWVPGRVWALPSPADSPSPTAIISPSTAPSSIPIPPPSLVCPGKYQAGHPLVGERVYIRDYAGAKIEAPRTMLHARSLAFAHPRSGIRVSFEREGPEDFRAMLEMLRA